MNGKKSNIGPVTHRRPFCLVKPGLLPKLYQFYQNEVPHEDKYLLKTLIQFYAFSHVNIFRWVPEPVPLFNDGEEKIVKYSWATWFWERQDPDFLWAIEESKKSTQVVNFENTLPQELWMAPQPGPQASAQSNLISLVHRFTERQWPPKHLLISIWNDQYENLGSRKRVL